MKIFFPVYMASLAMILTVGCGSKNFFDCDGGYAASKCASLTKDEEARMALDRGDLTAAVEILSDLIVDEPTNYERHTLLAAAYAGKAGLDLFNIVSANFGGDSSLLQVMESFIPTPTDLGDAYDNSLEDMNGAVTTLLTIPAELRSSTSADKYAASATLQLTLYQSAYGVMYLNKFTYGASGYDPTLLASMTPEDAAIILNAFLGASLAAGGDAATSANSAISAIQSQPGASDRDRLVAWSQAAR
jgi:hypothetical protein